jgi:hypothetical protein
MRPLTSGFLSGLFTLAVCTAAQANGKFHFGHYFADAHRWRHHEMSFQRIATVPNYVNAGLGEATVSEIIAATKDGSLLVYTDASAEALDPDGANSGEPPLTRIWIYDPADESWDHIGYELESIGPDATWVGLSEITEVGDGTYILIERDNRTGDFTDLKTLVRVRTRAGWDGIIEKHEKSVYDLVPALESTNGWITDKPEGVAVTRDGRVFVVTDNDGVEDWSGETWFLRLGRVRQLFH